MKQSSVLADLRRLVVAKNRRIGYAQVAATLALVISLAGTSYAVVRLPRNSVTAREIASGAVLTDEIANGQVKGADLAPGIRQALISLVFGSTTAPVQVGNQAFAEVLEQQLPEAGDEGIRLVEGNVEVTNTTTEPIRFGVRVIDVSSQTIVAQSIATVAPGETVSIPIDGTLETVSATTLRLQARTLAGPTTTEPSATVDRGSMSVTTSARRNH